MTRPQDISLLHDDKPDAEVIRRLGHLFTAVVSDVLDATGRRNQVMDARVRPLFPRARVVGRARTVEIIAVEQAPDLKEDHYKLQLESIDALTPNDVIVTSRLEVCQWGELMSVAAIARGATGVVIDGFVRDVAGIEQLGFPTFATGVNAADALGRAEATAIDVPIVSGGVRVESGDLILADRDGVVVVPATCATEVVALAEAKVSGESEVRSVLTGGMSVVEAFERYGVL